MNRSSNPAEGRRLEAHRLAAEIRRVIERLVLVDAPEEDLRAAADAAAAFADRLTGLKSRRWYEGFAEAANAGTPSAFFDHSPIIGLANPLAPPIRMEVTSDSSGEQSVAGRVTFGAAYEGPPSSVHGGYVAAAFDEVLGFAQTLTGKMGMTGTLTIKYRNPTPLFTELLFSGEVVRVEGRKIFTAGKCHAGDLLTAEAEAVFIAVDFEKFAKLMVARDGASSNED